MRSCHNSFIRSSSGALAQVFKGRKRKNAPLPTISPERSVSLAGVDVSEIWCHLPSFYHFSSDHSFLFPCTIICFPALSSFVPSLSPLCFPPSFPLKNSDLFLSPHTSAFTSSLPPSPSLPVSFSPQTLQGLAFLYFLILVSQSPTTLLAHRDHGGHRFWATGCVQAGARDRGTQDWLCLFFFFFKHSMLLFDWEEWRDRV